MEWTWDDQKARANFVKHGVLFETAAMVFVDEYRISKPDPHVDDERWRTIGMVGETTLFVVHSVIETDGSGRMISARKATPTERRYYEGLRF